MARRKKPDNETSEQERERRIIDFIYNQSDRSEKTSWDRKMNNMVSLLAQLRPLEEQILDLTAQKMPIIDDVSNLRETMVNECIHPPAHLVVKDDHVLCKFCNKKIGIPREFTNP